MKRGWQLRVKLELEFGFGLMLGEYTQLINVVWEKLGL
jgi:hypothetical protein